MQVRWGGAAYGLFGYGKVMQVCSGLVRKDQAGSGRSG